MQTTCPECRTVFRVSQEHLGLRRGLVRCGKCNAVFNAYDTLLAELEEAPIPAPPEGLPDRQPLIDALSDDTTLPQLSIPAWRPEMPALQAEAFAPAVSTKPAAAEPAEKPAGETPESILLSELPNRQPVAQSSLPLWTTLLYGLGIGLLILLLALQLAYFLRAELAAALPQSRYVLESLCASLACEVPLPRQLTKQAIVASNLEHDPEQKSRVRLTFLLANRTGQAQAWPQVSLTLTDVREAPVARKLFPPEVYLPKDADIRAGMPAGSEREVRLELDIGNLAATGFALGLVYP